MRVRRCKVLFLEPREQVDFELQGLLSGGDGLRRTQQWLALAPHIGSEVEVNAAERELLGRLSPETWVDSGELARDGVALKSLLGKGLVLAKGKRHAEWRLRDEALREVSWFPLAATLHAFTRWDQVDAVQSMVVAHFLGRDVRSVQALPAPGIKGSDWTPPLGGLIAR